MKLFLATSQIFLFKIHSCFMLLLLFRCAHFFTTAIKCIFCQYPNFKAITIIFCTIIIQRTKIFDLKFQPVLFSAVLLDLRVDVLHQGVSLHQHVSKGWTGKRKENFELTLTLTFTFFGCVYNNIMINIKLVKDIN
jgi:hypothetical protein